MTSKKTTTKKKKCSECKKVLGAKNKTGFCRKCLDDNRKGIGGVDTKMTHEVLAKLEQAFSVGANDQEACFFADINPSTLFRYEKKFPEFCTRKAGLKEKIVLKARTTVANSLIAGNVKTAKWLLERRRRDEFATKTVAENTDTLIIKERSEKQKEAVRRVIDRELKKTK